MKRNVLQTAAQKMSLFLNLMRGNVFNNGGFSRVSKFRGISALKNHFATDAALDRVKKSNDSGQDNILLLAIMGDVGSALMDYDPNADDTNLNGVFHSIVKYMLPSGKHQSDFLEEISKIKREKGGSALCPSKKLERDNLAGKNLSDLRSGVFNQGSVADLNLGITSGQIPHSNWPWQTVPKERMLNCDDEPWAGHLSGSIIEVLYVFDLVTLNTATSNITRNSLERRIKAAFSAAFLIAFGYHSAIEIEITIRDYLGDDPIQLAENPTHITCPNEQNENLRQCMRICGENVEAVCSKRDATSYISNLLQEFTNS